MSVASSNSAFLTRLRARHQAALNNLAASELARLKASVSTPGPAASAPGQPPHTQSGKLAASLHASAKVAGSNSTLRFASSAPHAPLLEYGTSKMAPRPFMAPHAARLRQRLASALAKALQR